MSNESAEIQQQVFGDSVFSNLFETFVERDLLARMERGELPKPFPASDLRTIQIVFYPDGRPPSVRINSEVRAVAQVRPKAGVAVQAGDPVTFDMIESIGVIALAETKPTLGTPHFLDRPMVGLAISASCILRGWPSGISP